ncbi:hypothetical protein DES38_104237 [Streptohalobacillus salinus]|uniref:Cyclophilin-like domain-containing protein n=2 Tax=Streptohalobacillus salinus TaxID=621096 RepID=A0A2V3WCT3_9BACI|nr:hypothetical protein DES38_104237 [Streptohalobacillus salinus]
MQLLKALFAMLLTFFLLTACGTMDDDNEENTGTNDQTEDMTSDEDEIDSDDETDSDDDPSDDMDDEETDDDQPSLPDLAEEKTVTMQIEGMEETIQVDLHQDEAADFSVYVPEDMLAEFDDGNIDIFTNFTATLNRDARFFIYEEDQDDMLELLNAQGFTAEGVEDDAFVYTNSLAEWVLAKDGFTGRVSQQTHGDETFMLGYHYPVEYGDGFSARSAIIVDELVWHKP